MGRSNVVHNVFPQDVSDKIEDTRFTRSFFFWQSRAACGILVPQPGIEPGSPQWKLPSPNHWTAREFPLDPIMINVEDIFYFSPSLTLLSLQNKSFSI